MTVSLPPSTRWSWRPVGKLGRVASVLVGLTGLGGAWTGMAAPGDLDPTFVAGGVTARAVAVQPDGRVVFGGSRLTRLLASGANDTSFTTTQGPTSNSNDFSCVAVQADGRLVVGGAFIFIGGVNRPGLARLLPDGKVDSSFGARVGGAQSEVQALEIETDGSILVGGTFTTINDMPYPGLARLRPDGTPDPTFAPSVSDTPLAVFALARQENGQWLVSRSFRTPEGETKFEVTRLQADGSADASFTCDVDAPVHTIVVQADQTVLLGGAFLSVNGRSQPRLARVAADGTLDSTFAPVVSETISSLALQADGTLVVETTMDTPLGARAGLHWLDAAGTRAGPFRPRATATLHLMLQHDGRLVAGGTAPAAVPGLPPSPMRLLNSPAVHGLDVLDGGRIRWSRGGSAPETQQTTVETSEDGGRTYGSAVPGLRVQGGWEFAGLGDVSGRRLRLRARVSGGIRNGSSHLAEWVTVAGANRPTPEVHQPAGTLVNPAEGRRFPDTDVGGSTSLTFTLLNTGTADLRLDAVVMDGPGAPSFVLTTPLPAVLPGPYGSATFGVSFFPQSEGDATASLAFFSPDPLLGRFTLRLDGRGRNPAPSSNSELSELRLGSGVLTPAFAPAVKAYTATQQVHNASIDVTARPASSKARVTITGVPPAPDASSAVTVPLEVGTNAIPIVVTAENGSQTTYQLTVTRASQPGPGHIDTAFTIPRSLSVATAVPLPGGQILVRGTFPAPHAASFDSYCFWLNADGSLLRALPPSVVAYTGNLEGTVAVQRDGRVLVTGRVLDEATGRYRLLQRFLPDGTPDPSFVSPLAPAGSTEVSAIAVLPDDAILIAGSFADLGDEPRSRLARLRPDGSLDPTFAPIELGSPGWDNIETLLVQPDGKILIGGGFLTVSGVARGKLARLHADGTVDDTFRPVVTEGQKVKAMALQLDGKLVVAGNFSIVRGADSIDTQRFSLARFHPDGTLDSAFAPAVVSFSTSPGDINSLALDTLGRLYIGGSFSQVGGQPRKNMARLLPDGSVDPVFAPDFGSGVRCLALEAGGTVLAAAPEAWGLPTTGLVRLHNDPATDQLTVDSTGRVDWVRGGSAPEVDRVWVEASNTQGGNFVPRGEATRSAQGWTWSSAALPPGGQVRVQADVRVGYAAGSMSRVTSIAPISRPASPQLKFFLNGTPIASGSVLSFPSAAGVPVELSLQVRNAGETTVAPLTRTIDGPDAAAFAVVRPLPLLRAGGESELGLRFSPLGVGERSARLRLTAPGVSPIEFSLRATAALSTDTSLASLTVVDWLLQPAFSPAIVDYACEVASSVQEVRLIAPPSHPVARLRVDGREVADPAAGTVVPLNGEQTTAVLEVTAQDGVSKGIYRLVVHRRPAPRPGDLDSSFIADVDPARFLKGVPQADGGVMIQERVSSFSSTLQLRRLKPDGSQDPGFLPYQVEGGFIDPPTVISLPDGGCLLGSSTNGIGSPTLVRLRKNGMPDPDFGLRPGVPVLAGWVQCLAVQPDGGILLGGSFTSIGGIARTSIARFTSNGRLDVSFAPVLAGFSFPAPPTLTCLAVQADGRILVGGTFNKVDGVNRQFLARLERDGRLDPSFQPVVKSAPFAITFDSSNRILAFTDFSRRQFNDYTRYLQNGTTNATQRFLSGSIANALPQADGRLVFGGLGGRLNGVTLTSLFRLEADGAVDPTMELHLPLEESVSQMAGFQDGRLMMVAFKYVNGLPTRRLFRVLNDMTSESLRVTDSSRIRWERQGTAPEAHYVTFALSTDGGVTFSDLGLASRVENGWELAGLALPETGHIRAHARYVAGPANRDSSLAESITAYSLVSGPREAWRQRHFGTVANDGPAADGADPDGDGLTNFAEFAGGSDPKQASEAALQSLAGTTGPELRVAFVRSREAMESGVTWVVEWSDTLSNAVPWSSTGVAYSVISDAPNSQLILARVPAGPLGQRFARLRIRQP